MVSRLPLNGSKGELFLQRTIAELPTNLGSFELKAAINEMQPVHIPLLVHRRKDHHATLQHSQVKSPEIRMTLLQLFISNSAQLRFRRLPLRVGVSVLILLLTLNFISHGQPNLPADLLRDAGRTVA